MEAARFVPVESTNKKDERKDTHAGQKRTGKRKRSQESEGPGALTHIIITLHLLHVRLRLVFWKVWSTFVLFSHFFARYSLSL